MQGFRFKFGQKRTLERIFKCRINHICAVFQNCGDETQKSRFRIIFVNKTVSRRRFDRADDFADFVNVNFVRKLCPKNYSRFGKFAPNCPRRFNAGKFGHLNIENAQRRTVFEREFSRLFAVFGFDHGQMRGKFFGHQFANVSALRFVVFGN